MLQTPFMQSIAIPSGDCAESWPEHRVPIARTPTRGGAAVQAPADRHTKALPTTSTPKSYRLRGTQGPFGTALWVTFGTQSGPLHGDADAFPAGVIAAATNPQSANAIATCLILSTPESCM